MFLSRFRVRGYKCLEDVDLPLTPFHAIVGPNGSGKSCLLEAISALYGRLKTPPAQWFPAAACPRDLIAHGSNVPAIDLAGQWSERLPPDGSPAPAAGYGLSIIVPASGMNLAVMDQWVRPRAGDDPHAGLSRKAFAYPHSSGTPTAEDRAALAAFHDVVQPVLQPAPVYRLDPRRLAEPVEPDRETRGHLEWDGYGLAALLQDVATTHAERFKEIQAEFCRLVPVYRGIAFQMEPRKGKTKPLRGGKLPIEPPSDCALRLETCSGRIAAAREVSAGTLLLLALVTIARLPAPPTLLLIENPEHGIYRPLLADVIGALRKLTEWSEGRRTTQVIVTTHSAAVQSFFGSHELTALSRPENQPDGPVLSQPLAKIV